MNKTLAPSLPFSLSIFSHFTPHPSFRLQSPRIRSSSAKRYQKTVQPAADGSGTALLWFKHDLRVDDHPALAAAAASHHHTLLPLYVFDPRILSRFSDELIELLLVAVKDLRRSLQAHGSNLVIRFGDAEHVIRDLVKQVKVTDIFAEEEVEYGVVDTVKEALSDCAFLDWDVKITSWTTPYYNLQRLEYLPSSYVELRKLEFSAIKPLDPPLRLPSFHHELDCGNVPTFDDVQTFMSNRFRKGSWELIKETSADIALRKDHMKLVGSYDGVFGDTYLPKSENSFQNSGNNLTMKRPKNSVFGTSQGNIVAGGTDVVLNALAAYLRYLEGTARGDWQEVHQKMFESESETKTGASFHVLFGPALQLGIVSRRRVYTEAIKYEKERNAGFLSPFGYSTVTVGAAIDTVISMEWYWLRALKSQLHRHFPHPPKLWRWKGYLIQYTVVGSEGPCVLLVHGFGAFLEHYRDNFQSIADGRNQVWGLTLLGFGESEKPNIVYTELMWAELLRDFIVEVVGEPVHLVGNSMGGYFAALVGGLWPSLTKSVILINTAGDVIPGYSSLLFSKQRRISTLAWVGSRLLLQYLRFSLGSIVKNCYPTRVERADDWLINEMLRASYDPGVVAVLESVFSFNLAIPLNHLLAKLKDNVLIIQGMKDPIADSKSKLAMFKEHCKGIEIIELDAGHCPHDECPEEVNSMITNWVGKVERRLSAESSP